MGVADFVVKTCYKCGKEKPLAEFYKESKMADGHFNKCKECANKDYRVYRKHKLDTDPTFKEKERKRGRERHRKFYSNIRKSSGEQKKCDEKYAERFPEKRRAKNSSKYITTKKGYNNHHWSYNIEHFKDVISLLYTEHYKLHRYMIYDQERMMYRTLQGVLLDTREKHILYCESIKELD